VPRLSFTWLIAGVVLAAAMAAASVHGAGHPPEAQARLANGTLSLSNSLNGGAVLTAQNLKPGDSRTGQVTVNNTGSLDGAFSLAQANLVDTPGPFGGRLSDGLQLSVEQISAGGSTVSSVYSGVLSGLGTRQLGTLAAGESRNYRFTATFPDGGHPPAPGAGDNGFQRSAVQVDYVWTATADDPGGGGGMGWSGNGGGGNGGGDGGWPSGTPPFTLKLSGKKRQRVLGKRSLAVDAWCSADCTLRWSMKVLKARKRGKKRRPRMVVIRAGKVRSRKPIALPAAKRSRIKIKPSRRCKRALRSQLRKRGRTVAVVSVTATSGAVKVTAKRQIALKR
jgi:spore coat-associated protein N